MLTPVAAALTNFKATPPNSQSPWSAWLFVLVAIGQSGAG